MDRATPLPSKVDICVAGGGPAGLTAAAAFGALGFEVLCVDPAPPVTERESDGADLRTTAFLQPSRDFLDRIGLWPRLASEATPLQIMRIVDAGGTASEPRLVREFDAGDLGALPFGWNLPNWLLRRELAAHLDALPNVSRRTGTGVARQTTRLDEIRVTLDDGSTLAARLLIAADGRNSQIRQAAGIGVRTLRYGQKALAFAVTHPIPHDNISTEIHRSGGPFTLVPLPDFQGRPSSAVVWMERGAEAQNLAALPEDAFNAAASIRSCHLLGPLTLVTRRTLWPIISQVAARFHAPRTALVAEAAHVVPPIGAQGLNMSLADIACLHDLARAAPGEIGSPAMLSRYTARRRPDILARLAGIDVLNRAAMTETRALRDLRMRGLDALHRIGPVRRSLMKLGLGAR